ncbi:Dehydrogenasesshort chain protein 30, partial [Aphelenchoides avenae]
AFFDSLRGEERPRLQVLTVSAGYINTGFGSRALTAEGKPIGVEDENQLKGMSPEYAARRIVDALAARKTELVLAKFVHRFAIFMRVFTPDLLWWVLHRRAKKELDAQRQKRA